MKKFTDSSKVKSVKLKKNLKKMTMAAVLLAVGATSYISIGTDNTATLDKELGATNIVATDIATEEVAEKELSDTQRYVKGDSAVALAEVTTEEATEALEIELANNVEITMVPSKKNEKTTEGLPEDEIMMQKDVATTEAAKKTKEDEECLPEEELMYVDGAASGTYLGSYLLTAYCPCPKCCGQWSNMENPMTASGNPAVEGVTIAAPPEFPFGTELIIDGHTYTVMDRGGAIKGKHIDVYFSSHERALNFAMGYYDVYVK